MPSVGIERRHVSNYAQIWRPYAQATAFADRMKETDAPYSIAPAALGVLM